LRAEVLGRRLLYLIGLHRKARNAIAHRKLALTGPTLQLAGQNLFALPRIGSQVNVTPAIRTGEIFEQTLFHTYKCK
jgi:hypothetical protein